MIDQSSGPRVADEARRLAEEARRAEEARAAAQQAAAAASPVAAPTAAVPQPSLQDGYEKSSGPTPFASQQVPDSGPPDVSVAGSILGFDPRADVNLDGKVNILDLAKIAGAYGQQGRFQGADLDGNNRVDILDLSRAASAFDTQTVTGTLQATFDQPIVGEDPVRGAYLKLGGLIEFPGNVKDSYFVIKSAAGDQVVKGTVDTSVSGKWSLVLLEKDLPESLLRSDNFEVTLYIEREPVNSPDGTWGMAKRVLQWPT
jgi:hypothetical protein